MFHKFARRSAKILGHPSAFAAACVVILLWAASGPVFHFSDTWQLVINTGTTIVTFLMVFLIQHAQNHDGSAIHLKLDELIRATKDAREAFERIEDQTEEEVRKLREEMQRKIPNVIS